MPFVTKLRSIVSTYLLSCISIAAARPCSVLAGLPTFSNAFKNNKEARADPSLHEKYPLCTGRTNSEDTPCVAIVVVQQIQSSAPHRREEPCMCCAYAVLCGRMGEKQRLRYLNEALWTSKPAAEWPRSPPASAILGARLPSRELPEGTRRVHGFIGLRMMYWGRANG